MPPFVPHLTGLRGLAAMMVLIAHLIGVLPRDFVFLTNFSQALAYSGICIFFVLSGFVITYNYADTFVLRGDRGWATYKFLVARFARLYPLYLFIMLCAEWTRCESAACITSYLTMTQSWFGLQSNIPATELTWTISTEWFFYVAFLLFVPLVNRISTTSTVWIGFGLSVVVAIATQWMIYQNQNSLGAFMTAHTWIGNNLTWLSYYSPYLRLFDFILGVLMAKLIMLERASVSSRGGGAVTLCIVTALGLATLLILDAFGIFKVAWPFLDYLRESHLYAPLIAILLYASTHSPGTLRWFASPVALFFGNRSYAIYLSQFFGPMLFPLLAFASIADSRWETAGLQSLLLLTVLFLVVEVMHRLIDTPMRRALRTVLTPRRQA